MRTYQDIIDELTTQWARLESARRDVRTLSCDIDKAMARIRRHRQGLDLLVQELILARKSEKLGR